MSVSLIDGHIDGEMTEREKQIEESSGISPSERAKMDLRETSVEVLQARKKCDLCLKEKCDKRCTYRKNYTYQQIEKAYDEAISYLECRPAICPNCGRGCFSHSRYCSHCGIKLNTKSNKKETDL